jgi:hypothetical protein
MSHQHSSASRIPFPTRNLYQIHRVEAQPHLLPTPQVQWMHRPPILSTYTLVPDSAMPHSPKTPPRTGTISSANAPPSIDGIRALYRKYPDRFPQTPPRAGTMPPNAPGGLGPPRYRNSVSPDSPTPNRPRNRPSTISYSASTSRRNAIPTSLTRDPRRKQPAVDASELTLMYPDFDPGFVPAEDPAPSLTLEIQPCDTEKWELPRRE